MNLLKYFKNYNKKNTAKTAKERLQIIISHERATHDSSDVLTLLQQDLFHVISKYFPISPEELKEQVKLDVEQSGDHSVLELNITLPTLNMSTALPASK